MTRFAWSILLLIPFGATATEVYRSVDENGQLVFSDRPNDATETVVIRPVVDRFDASGRAVGNRSASPPVTQDAEPTTADAAEPVPLSAEERARNCQVAQERAETFASSRRLFRTLPDGEREYLSDVEIEQARASAQSDVANWCG